MRPDECIIIIITTDEGDLIYTESSGTRSQREVLSVRRNWIF